MARSFDGVSDRASATAAQLATGTIGAWINVTTLPATGDVCNAVAFRQAADSEPYGTFDKQIGVQTDGTLNGKIYDGAAKTAFSTTLVTTGRWYHVAITFDGTNLRIWVNGVNEATTAAGNSYTSFTGPTFSLAPVMVDAGATRINATLAEVFLSSAILVTNEIAGIARGISAKRVRPASILGYWPLFGLQSPEPDLSGQANSMTLTGTGFVGHAPVTLFTPKSRASPAYFERVLWFESGGSQVPLLHRPRAVGGSPT